MTTLHWKQATDTLTKLVRTPRFGLFSDMDGTLAPIASSPQEAQLSPRGRQLLAALRDAFRSWPQNMAWSFSGVSVFLKCPRLLKWIKVLPFAAWCYPIVWKPPC